MKGDFSRGDRPDGRHGGRYRRVLMQQDRVLLDSDFNALGEALDGSLRDVLRHLGPGGGSPDLAGLVTEGRLLRHFRTLEGISPTEGARLDYSTRVQDLLPTLRLSTGTEAASFVLAIGEADLAIRVHAEAADAAVTIGEAAVGADMAAVEAQTDAEGNLTIALEADARAWIGLIEAAPEEGTVHVTPGTWFIDGLTARLPAAALARPEGAGVVVLEVQERLVTPVDAPHLRDPAAGVDTALRTVVDARLALIPVVDTLTRDAARSDMSTAEPGGTLRVSRIEGLTDNRLYRFEVHRGPGDGAAVLIWSAENAARITTATLAREDDGLTLTIADPDWRDGDLVELLTAGGTEAPSHGEDGLRPGDQRGGPIARLQRTHRPDEYTLDRAVELDEALQAVHLRRWGGELSLPEGADPVTQQVDTHVHIELTGPDFIAGSFWHFEARALAPRADDISRPPDGPERHFVPLARVAEDIEWWGAQLQPPAELSAERVGFRAGDDTFEATTVQDALDTLFQRPLAFDGEGHLRLRALEAAPGAPTPDLIDLHVGASTDRWPTDGAWVREPSSQGQLTLLNADGKAVTLRPADYTWGEQRGLQITDGDGWALIGTTGSGCYLHTNRARFTVQKPMTLTEELVVQGDRSRLTIRAANGAIDFLADRVAGAVPYFSFNQPMALPEISGANGEDFRIGTREAGVLQPRLILQHQANTVDVPGRLTCGAFAASQLELVTAGRRITFGESHPSYGTLRLTSPHGRVDIGPANAGTCHFFTDRPNFWFEKRVIVQGDVSAYERDLNLGTWGRGGFSAGMTLHRSGGVRATIHGWLKIAGADLWLDESSRRAGHGGAERRALVHWDNDVLALNFGGDYRGGTRVMGSTLVVDGTLRANNRNLADCAEQLPVAEGVRLAPGDVAVIDSTARLDLCRRGRDSRAAGVVSGAGGLAPALLLAGARDEESHAPIAMMGTVYVKADAAHGSIAVGELLTTSPTPGHAMRVDDPKEAIGAIIGKALQPLTEGRGLILMLVALQ